MRVGNGGKECCEGGAAAEGRRRDLLGDSPRACHPRRASLRGCRRCPGDGPAAEPIGLKRFLGLLRPSGVCGELYEEPEGKGERHQILNHSLQFHGPISPCLALPPGRRLVDWALVEAGAVPGALQRDVNDLRDIAMTTRWKAARRRWRGPRRYARRTTAEGATAGATSTREPGFGGGSL